MKKFKKYIGFTSVLIFYALLYLATTKTVPCNDDCERIAQLSVALMTNRPYVGYLNRCKGNGDTDTLCVFVQDNLLMNWNLFADTTCLLASQYGLPSQQIFIIKNSGTSIDTLAQKQCP